MRAEPPSQRPDLMYALLLLTLTTTLILLHEALRRAGLWLTLGLYLVPRSR